MGYNTYFSGQIEITPPLNTEEQALLEQLWRGGLEYYDFPYDGDIHVECSTDGRYLSGTDDEKIYDMPESIASLIHHFFGTLPLAKEVDPERFAFLQGHTLDGELEAAGEDSYDLWHIVVTNNQVGRSDGHVVYDPDLTIIEPE